MPYKPTTNFIDKRGFDLGQKGFVTKEYLLTVYESILDSSVETGLTVTPSVWVWGLNSSNELGIPGTTARNTPVTTILGGSNWKRISASGTVSVAIKTDGTLWNWGNNTTLIGSSFGGLGINDTLARTTPVTTILGGNNWKYCSSGGSFTVAIKTDGTLWGWGGGPGPGGGGGGGQSSVGQLGVNDIIIRSTPVTTILGGTNWKQVSGGSYHVAALKTDGTLWTWGYSLNGQLGNNGTATRSTPSTTLLGGNNWKSIGYGGLSALKTDGTLWVWGLNTAGQLGVNDNINRITPVTTILGGNDWRYAGFGQGIKTDGTLWVWGDNSQGQLGIGDTVSRSTPVTTILGGNDWKISQLGTFHVSAIKIDGTLWIWGGNGSGQLGVGDFVSRSTPVTTIIGGTNWKMITNCGRSMVTIISSSYI